MEHGYQVLLAGALDHHQVLHEEAILDVPAAVENARGGVQQVPQLLVVNFKETCLNIELLVAHSHTLPHVTHGAREETVVLVRGPTLSTQLVLDTRHGEGLAGTGLTVGEDGGGITL